MLYQVTHLSAPWPDGTAVGEMIELDTVPVWAVGKCRPAETSLAVAIGVAGTRFDPEAQGARPYIVTALKAPWPPGTKVGDIIGLAAVPVWAVGKCRPAHPNEIPGAAVAEKSGNDGLSDASEARSVSKEDLQAEAMALGVKIDARWGVARLHEEITTARSAVV